YPHLFRRTGAPRHAGNGSHFPARRSSHARQERGALPGRIGHVQKIDRSSVGDRRSVVKSTKKKKRKVSPNAVASIQMEKANLHLQKQFELANAVLRTAETVRDGLTRQAESLERRVVDLEAALKTARQETSEAVGHLTTVLAFLPIKEISDEAVSDA